MYSNTQKMPKSLSLKRSTAPIKNQKSITQFFKNTNVVPSLRTELPSSNDHCSPEKCLDQKPRKRKAQSPIKAKTMDKLMDPILPTSSNHIEHFTDTSKKFKMKNSKNIDDVKESPSNENYVKACCIPPLKGLQSPIKLTNMGHMRESQSPRKNIEPNSRSPLSQLKMNGALSNGDSNKACQSVAVSISNETYIGSVNDYLQNGNHANIGLKENTPKKSPMQELRRSPRIASLLTPEKNLELISPSKRGSTVKCLTFEETTTSPVRLKLKNGKPNSPVKKTLFGMSPVKLNGEVEDLFDDDWDIDEMIEDCKEDLDLSVMQRCQVISVTKHPTRIELKLKDNDNKKCTCFIEGIWLDTPLAVGEIISITANKDNSGQFCVSNSSGLLTLRPDHLLSATSIVAGVFCKRKAILQERWKGVDPPNIAMTIGIMVHELVQKAITQKIMDISQLRLETDKIIKESIHRLYDAGVSEEEAKTNMQQYISPLADFMQTYYGGKAVKGNVQKDQWNGHIEKVLDIEENLCCPQLGLKGKIDATLQVTIHGKKEPQIMPLELKSGKASVSAEHRGQLALYGAALDLQGTNSPAGLLLYLKDRVIVKEVSSGYHERRDLMMLRNQLVENLAPGPLDIDPEQISDIEDAAVALQQRLPEPISRGSVCAKCPYLTLCELHLWHTDGPSVSADHPLSELREQAIGHLSAAHIKYFLNWTALLKMEERVPPASPLHALWTDSVGKRVKRGTCAANLKIKSVTATEDRFIHVFKRTSQTATCKDKTAGRTKGPVDGEFCTVSVDGRPWLAAGVISAANEQEITIGLERDLTLRLSKDTTFHIDSYESQATTVQNLTNLGLLMEDTESAMKLRTLLIDKEPPNFEKKLPREVGRLGAKLMRGLNIQQQRAVLKAMAANDYCLLQGLPGTGKTQTISVLIQMFVALKKKVLVTAHTHSAVDTVLSRLPDTIKVMRLGPESRVSGNMRTRTERALTAKCQTTKELDEVYKSMEVVGVTCLGASHSLLSRTQFDMVVVDEAAQLQQSTGVRVLECARAALLAGDPNQLPPVVRARNARRLGMEESLYHRLMLEEATAKLQLQYRMNQTITDLANAVAYDGQLKCANDAVAEATLQIDNEKIKQYTNDSWLLTTCSPQPEHAVLYLDTKAFDIKIVEGKSKSCSNIEEASIIIAIIDALIYGGVCADHIGVISPYREQVTVLRPALLRRGVEGSTVDQFQGRDKPVILYTCTKATLTEDKVKEGEILNDQRRLAVSVTRAKHKLIIVGNSRALKRYAPMQRLYEACAPLPLQKNHIINLVHKYSHEFV